MADEDTTRNQSTDLLGEIDLLLDNEAGAEGARLRAAVEADPEAEALFRFSQSVQLALQKGMEDPEVPEGMWERFDLKLQTEPLPRASLLDTLHRTVFMFFQSFPRRWLASGTAFLFLITCGTLWWDGGAGFFPIVPPRVSVRSAGRALDLMMSDQLDREASAALDQMLLDFTLDQSLQGDLGSPQGEDPAKRGYR